MSLLKKITTIDKSYAHFRRYVEIGEVLAAFGMDEIFGRQWWRRLRYGRRRKLEVEKERLDVSRSQRVRLALETLGPTFVKLGQVLSSRPDLLSPDYIQELGKLRDKVPGFPSERAVAIIEKELGRPLSECYSYFEVEPFAAASIGQVHYATTLDQVPVVVKVQRPDIEKKISVDLEIMYHLAELLEKSDLFEYSAQRPTAIVEEFSHVLMRELDYVVEATNMTRFAGDMANQPGIRTPEVLEELSGHRVLTMTRVIGYPVNEVLANEELRSGFDLPLIARNGAAAVMAQIFEHGFFHADPHAGNLFLQEGNIVCFIDFGMMGRVTENARDNFIKAVRAMLDRNYAALTGAVLRLTSGQNGKVNYPRLERELAELVEDNLYLPMSKFSLAKVLEALMKLINSNALPLRSDMYVMFKALITIENIARELNPALAIIDVLEPAMKKARRNSLDWRRQWRQLGQLSEEFYQLIRELPASGRLLLEKARNDEFSVRLEHHGLFQMRETIRDSIALLAYAVVLASLVVGSALIVLSGVPPLWNRVPVIGIIGFVVSAVMGFGLLLHTHRRPR